MRNMQWAMLAVAGAMAAGPAMAQSTAAADAMEAGRQAGANQLGVMEYCQAQGFADADAVAAQRAALARLPTAPAGSPPTDDAEALGRQGTMSINGTRITLASLANAHGTTVAVMCGQMANVAKQTAAQLQGAPAMPGGMPAMPTMPGMPGAPSALPR